VTTSPALLGPILVVDPEKLHEIAIESEVLRVSLDLLPRDFQQRYSGWENAWKTNECIKEVNTKQA